MVNLKKLLKEAVWGKRKFGEPLPTMADYKKAHKERKINEVKKIDSREWKKIKNEIEDKSDDLVKIGEDYAVFQSAKHTSRTLKKIQKLWRSLLRNTKLGKCFG